MTIRDNFVEQFGEEQAAAIEAAAEEHKNGVHDNPGSDPFRWAICICIGFECMSREAFREHHGITAPWEELDAWIILHGNLGEHDGDINFLAALCGQYDKYVTQETVQ